MLADGPRPKDTGAGVATIPNVISTARLGLLALFLVTLELDKQRWLAAAILAVAGVTDFLDGYVARRFNQVSAVGKVLDPTVDRILLVGAMAGMIAYGAVPVWLAVVTLAREVLISLGTVALAASGAPRIDVLFIGKAGTFGLMVGFPLLLAGDGPGTMATAAHLLAWIVLVPSLVLAYIAAGAYVPKARHAFNERETVSVGSRP